MDNFIIYQLILYAYYISGPIVALIVSTALVQIIINSKVSRDHANREAVVCPERATMFKRIILPNILSLLFHFILCMIAANTFGLHGYIAAEPQKLFIVLFVPIVYFLFGYLLKNSIGAKFNIFSVSAVSIIILVVLLCANTNTKSNEWSIFYFSFSPISYYEISLTLENFFLALFPTAFIWSGAEYKMDNKRKSVFIVVFLIFVGFFWAPQVYNEFHSAAAEREYYERFKRDTVYQELSVLISENYPNSHFGGVQIKDENNKKAFEQDYAVVLPEIDQDKYYYVIWWGRRVEIAEGQMQTKEILNNNSMVIYKVNLVK